jgi:copper oxidase (laccase) domain-containing protein
VREVHWVDQVHGSTVVVAAPGTATPLSLPKPHRSVRSLCAGSGDALVSSAPVVAVAVLTADCAAIALGSREGVFAAVHAGWRGLVGGVVEAAVGAMRGLGATDVVGALGPCIHPGCYEFSEDDLAPVAGVYGRRVRGRTSSGRPALDVPATVSAALAAGGAAEAAGINACTACAGGYFSHRARAESGRQALIVWSAGGSVPE